MEDKRMQKLKEKALSLPLLPGVYLMRDENGKVIYVGKAKKLKNRVSSYFINSKGHSRKTLRMVSKIADFDYFITNTEVDALLLENTQIKLYMPYYNILLKDSKTFPYIKINLNDEYPKLEFTRKREQDKATYFGPFSGSAKRIIETVNKTFLLPSCNKQFPRDILKTRPCLNRSLKICMAPCAGDVTTEDYAQAIKGAVAFLLGNIDEVLTDLREKMAEESQAENYEKAAFYRDRLRAVERLHIRQKVVAAPDVNRDVIGFAENEFRVVFDVFFIRGGRISDRQSFDFEAELAENLPEALGEFMQRLYSGRADIPKEILCFESPADTAVLEEFLRKISGRKTEIITPKIGEKKKICEMVCKNAEESLRLLMTKEEKQAKSITELKKILGLSEPPRLIEAVDISNTAGSENVAAIIRYQNGEKDKSGYRHYKIKTVSGQDDYASMKEVLARRFVRYLNADAGFETPPNLLLLDGGAGHLSVVSEMLSGMGIEIPVFGMVKDDKHRTRGLVSKEGEIALKQGSPAAALIGKIQEEVHRFAIEYHRKKLSAPLTVSKLEKIEGVGKTTATKLLKHFGSLSGVSGAGREELLKVPGVTKKQADAITAFFAD